MIKERAPTPWPKAFTLVELVVVVALVLLLATAGMAGYHRMMTRAELGESLANLRQLAIANAGYAGDHGTFAPATDRRNRMRWHGSRGSVREPFDPTSGYLSPYLGESRRVGICPGLKHHVEGAGSWEDGSGGYGYNAVYIGGTPQDPFQPTRPSRVKRPSQTLMFATTAFAKREGLQEYPFAEPRFWVDPNGNLGGRLQPSVHFRFDGKALICWCDGRVTVARMNETSSDNYYGGDNEAARIGFPGPAEGNGWWDPNR